MPQIYPKKTEYWLSEIRDVIEEHDCPSCGAKHSMTMKFYRHEGGILMAGFTDNIRLWVYGHCSECKHDSAYWKILKKNDLPIETGANKL